MFWKWDKIPSTLYFTVTTVKIHKNFTDEFELCWARGDHSGSSQKLKPDLKHSEISIGMSSDGSDPSNSAFVFSPSF